MTVSNIETPPERRKYGLAGPPDPPFLMAFLCSIPPSACLVLSIFPGALIGVMLLACGGGLFGLVTIACLAIVPIVCAVGLVMGWFYCYRRRPTACAVALLAPLVWVAITALVAVGAVTLARVAMLVGSFRTQSRELGARTNDH